MKLLIALLIGVVVFWGVYAFWEKKEKESVADQQKTTNIEEPSNEQDVDVDYETQNNLDLSGQGLLQVPENIFNSTDLEVLNLSHNNLSGALQAEVRHLQKLKVLNLSYNNFTGVPAEIGQLSELIVLNLSNNPLTGLPHELSNLKKLEILDLRETQYSSHDLTIIKQGLPSTTQVLVD